MLPRVGSDVVFQFPAVSVAAVGTVDSLNKNCFTVHLSCMVRATPRCVKLLDYGLFAVSEIITKG